MEIDIRVKGGIELSVFYPEEYEMFEEKVGDLIKDMFPGVDCFIMGKEPTDRHKAEEEARQKARDLKLKAALVEIIQKPEMQELLRGRVAAPTGN